MKQRKLFLLVVVLALLLTAFGCKTEPENKVVRMSTTTSVNDSGLMAFLQPEFEKATGYTLEITSAGTGAAIEKARMGDADLLLVHSKSAEEEYINEGFGEVRVPFMYNFYVIVGPAEDPAGVASAATAADAFKSIADTGALFISRGDNSGTNNKELAIWKSIDFDPAGQAWYESIGQGMGQTLTVADERQAYTLSDKATFLAHEDSLSMLLEATDDMMNTYSMIVVTPERFAETNAVGAQAFVDWIATDAARALIADYGKAEYGEALFFNLD